MKPLTNDQPRTTLSQGTTFGWGVEPRPQQPMLDIAKNDVPGISSSLSTSSGSPPFSLASAPSPLDVTGAGRAGSDSPFGAQVAGIHRRQPSRASTSAENIFGALGHSTTPRSKSFDPRLGHPYAHGISMSTNHLHNFARKRRGHQLDSMVEDQHLENLWSMHGVTGSAHLGAGIMDQFAGTHLRDDETWGTSLDPGSAIEEVFRDTAYYDPSTHSDQFTVDPSLRSTYDLRHPFADDNLNFVDEDLLHAGETELDMVEEHPPSQEESPHSEEQEPDSTLARRSTSADSSATAAPTKRRMAEDEDEDKAIGSDHEQQGGDKSHSSKPTANNFVNKLHLMISDPKAKDFIWWNELGTSFVVSSAGEFSRSILGQHFKHNNFSSFVRQLNMYGFHKINRTPRNQRVQPDAQQWEFSHPKFLRGRQDLLDDIKRKPVEPDPSGARQRVELPSEVAAKLREMAIQHEEVVNALQFERKRSQQLAIVVKMLYDRLALQGPLPMPFPSEVLDARPPLHSLQVGGMDLSGDSLVPSRGGASSSNNRGRQPPAQISPVSRTTRRGKADADGHTEAPVSHAVNGVSPLSLEHQNNTLGVPSGTGYGLAQQDPMISLAQIKHEMNGFAQ